MEDFISSALYCVAVCFVLFYLVVIHLYQPTLDYQPEKEKGFRKKYQKAKVSFFISFKINCQLLSLPSIIPSLFSIFFFPRILLRTLSLCSCNYFFSCTICNYVGSVYFLPLLEGGKEEGKGVHKAHYHMGLLTLQLGHITFI